MKNGIDHHFSCYILQSTLETLSKELLVLFVKEYIKFGKEATETNFQNILENVKDENYTFIYLMKFSYLLGFHLCTESVCKNIHLECLGPEFKKLLCFICFAIQSISNFIYEIDISMYKCLRN